MILGRANSSLLGFEILNPDETQMIANAIGIASRDFNLFYFDGNSSGIFNSLILTWPQMLNLDITFLSTRITALLLLSIIIFLTFKISKKNLSNTHSLLICFPLTIFFSFTKDPDFLHYSSELLSTFIIILSYWLIIQNEEKKLNKFFYFLIPTMLGIIFFSKVQFAPVALTIFLLIFLNSYLSSKLSFNLCVLIFFFSSIPFILLTYYYLNGSLKDFYINYFQYPKDYITVMNDNNSSSMITESLDNKSIKNSKNFYVNHLIYNSALHYFYIYFLLLIFILNKFFNKKTLQELVDKYLVLNLLVIISISVCIIIPGRNFRHYLISLMPFIPILFSLLISFLLKKNLIKKYKINQILIFIILIFSTSLILEDKKFYSQKFKHTPFRLVNVNFQNPELFQYLKTNEKEKLYIWGWMPKWYILGGLNPSSRSTISEKLIENNNYKNYYRKRLIEDLTKSTPNLIIDFVRPKSFKHTSEKDILEEFIDLKNFTKSGYRKLVNKNLNCPTYYLSNENFVRFNKKNIQYFFIKEKYYKINDFSVTDDVCDDKYNFDISDEDEFSIYFKKTEKIKDIYILSSKTNSKNSYLDLKILNNKDIIYKKKVLLKKYPFWNKVELNTKFEADSILFDVQNLKLSNYGINEIKIFKE